MDARLGQLSEHLTSQAPDCNGNMAVTNKPFTLISATPSPYARINRIAMIEKGIPFELQSEVDSPGPQLHRKHVLISPDSMAQRYANTKVCKSC